jgi:transcription termination factor 2
VVLYRCQNWSLTLREEHRLRAFKNRVLRRTFGPNRDEVTGDRKLHNEELHNLYSLPKRIKSRRMGWAGHVARMEEPRNAYMIFMGKPEGKRPLGRPRRRWVVNIETNLRGIGWHGTDWIDLAQDRDQ